MIIGNIVINNIKTLSVKLLELTTGSALEIKQEGGLIEIVSFKDHMDAYNVLLLAEDELNPKPIGSIVRYGLKDV